MNDPSIVHSVHSVEHARTWREEGFVIHFILLLSEPSGEELLSVYVWANKQGFKNPRVISPQTLVWSSLFQPRFFASISGRLSIPNSKSIRLTRRAGEQSFRVLQSLRECSLFWLQSASFLASVTLSAAIIQGRWSNGTLASKYDRLWVTGLLSKSVAPDLARLNLLDRVRDLAADRNAPAIERLLAVRRLYESVIEVLAVGVPASRVRMRAIPSSDERFARFGFVNELRAQINELEAIIVYGSSISSEHFADYDVVLVVKDPEAVLRRLENVNPHWSGKELNIGVYSPTELWSMQLLSGDNLANYGVCIFGEVELPAKSVPLLLARNLSFGMVRQRQQLGMISAALIGFPNDGDDRRNLYNYFVKIPSNIAKGTFGATGVPRCNEDIQEWLVTYCDFDTPTHQKRALNGHVASALASSAVATGAALRRLNEELSIVEDST